MSGVAQRSGPPGNKNSSKENRLFADTVRRLAVQENGKRLRQVVESLYTSAEAGEVPAIKEIADRLDGKVPQGIVGADGGPLTVQVVKFADDPDSR